MGRIMFKLTCLHRMGRGNSRQLPFIFQAGFLVRNGWHLPSVLAVNESPCLGIAGEAWYWISSGSDQLCPAISQLKF